MPDRAPLRAAILTALPVEYDAVRAHLTALTEQTHPRGTIYEIGRFVAGKTTWEVGIVEVGTGNVNAALEAQRALEHLRPSVALFVGVAGGIKDVALGDVVAATKIYGYESGKAARFFLPRPDVGNSSYRMVQRARADARREEWLRRTESSLSQARPRVFLAPIAAGEKVISSTRSPLFRFLRREYGDALAVEMEGRGFLQAAAHQPEVDVLVIRGISDMIDDKPNADAASFQEVASRHAAAFAFEVLSRWIPRSTESTAVEADTTSGQPTNFFIGFSERFQLTQQRRDLFLTRLRAICDDATLSVNSFTEGSRVLSLVGTRHVLDHIRDLHDHGELRTALTQEIVCIFEEQLNTSDSPFEQYLRAMLSFCDELPYAIAPGVLMPPLSSVYLERHSEGLDIPFRARSAASEELTLPKILGASPETIEQALAQQRHIVIEAGPGLGKSTLLRHLGLTLIGQWFDRFQAALIPVFVPLRGLSAREGSFSESLLREVASVIGQRLPTELPDGLFAKRPQKGGKWLVLLDGLDEIVDEDARRRVLAGIKHHIDAASPLYRFVVTTRPISDIDVLRSDDVALYTLRPLQDDQILEFATRWFVSRELSAELPERFVRQLHAGKLDDLMRVPLLLTMAAVVYERDPDHSIPRHRVALYERIVNILMDSEEARRGTRSAFRREWARRYGRLGAEWADRVFSHRRQLLQHLATNVTSLETRVSPEQALRIAVAQGWLPPDLDSLWAMSQLETVLVRSGLLLRRGTGFDFIHETFREYLLVSGFVDSHRPDDPDARRTIANWIHLYRHQLALFALQLWSERHVDVATLLVWLINLEDADGEERCVFVAAAIAEGIYARSEAIDHVVTDLARAAEATGGPELVAALAGLANRTLVVEVLTRIAYQPARGRSAIAAARVLVDLGRKSEAADCVVAVGLQVRGADHVRAEAMDMLVSLDEYERAVQVATVLGGASETRFRHRLEAANVLFRYGDKKAARMAVVLAVVQATDTRAEHEALDLLESFGLEHAEDTDDLAATLLSKNWATRPGIVASRVADLLGTTGRVAAAGKIWQTIGSDAPLELRLYAAQRLEEIGDTGGAAQAWAGLAADATVSHGIAAQAAGALERLGRLQAAATAWTAVVTTPSPLLRIRAAKALSRLGHRELVLGPMGRLAYDPTEHIVARIDAAETLAEIGENDMAKAPLLSLARDDAVIAAHRLRAVRILGELGERTAAASILRQLVAGASDVESVITLSNELRLLGCPDDAVDVLMDAQSRAAFDASTRREIAIALWDAGASTQAESILKQVATDTAQPEWIRTRAWECLAELGLAHHDAISWLDATARDTHLPNWLRIDASVSLVRLGEREAGLAHLSGMVRDLLTRAPWEVTDIATSLEDLEQVDDARAVLDLLADSPTADPELRQRAAARAAELRRPNTT